MSDNGDYVNYVTGFLAWYDVAMLVRSERHYVYLVELRDFTDQRGRLIAAVKLGHCANIPTRQKNLHLTHPIGKLVLCLEFPRKLDAVRLEARAKAASRDLRVLRKGRYHTEIFSLAALPDLVRRMVAAAVRRGGTVIPNVHFKPPHPYHHELLNLGREIQTGANLSLERALKRVIRKRGTVIKRGPLEKQSHMSDSLWVRKLFLRDGSWLLINASWLDCSWQDEALCTLPTPTIPGCWLYDRKHIQVTSNSVAQRMNMLNAEERGTASRGRRL